MKDFYMSMQNLYQHNILEHYQHPKNCGLFTPADFVSPCYNPSCGDSITICGLINNAKITRLAFEGKGCVLSIAMASLLTEFAQGKTVEEVCAYDEALVEQLLGMQLGLKRVQCGLLSIQALQKGLQNFKKNV
jgi:nitrogen fixation NifU-like protein